MGVTVSGTALRVLSGMSDRIARAAAEGLNRTIDDVEDETRLEMGRRLDRPKPFTVSKKAFGRFKAVPRAGRKLNAVLFIKSIQSGYLRHTIDGGRLSYVLTPTKSMRLNKYGNITGKQNGLDAIAARSKKKFVAEINGTFGLWERFGRGGREVRPLVYIERNATRREKWSFEDVAQRVADRKLRRHVADALVAQLRRR